MYIALPRRVFLHFLSLEMLVNLTQYGGTVGVFNNQIFKGRMSKMAISYTVLNRENFSISSNIKMFLTLGSVLLPLKYKYCRTARYS